MDHGLLRYIRSATSHEYSINDNMIIVFVKFRIIRVNETYF